jgi:hypothetical protein
MALLLASPQAGETRKVETERMITFCFASVWGESNLEGVTGVSYQALRLIVHLARAPKDRCTLATASHPLISPQTEPYILSRKDITASAFVCGEVRQLPRRRRRSRSDSAIPSGSGGQEPARRPK